MPPPVLTSAETLSRIDERNLIDDWVRILPVSFLSRLEPKVPYSNSRMTATIAKEKRRQEFAGGRRNAESLLKRLGCAEPVWSNEDRSPAWPDGFIGSISHSDRWTWAAVSRKNQLQSIGIDTEPVVTPETRSEILGDVATAEEWKLLEDSPLSSEQSFTLVFSAKEAFYKCCYPLVQQFFGFEHAAVKSLSENSVRIETHPAHPCFEAMPSALEVFYRFSAGSVFTATWVEAA
jgi:enterobactin synthetase component D